MVLSVKRFKYSYTLKREEGDLKKYDHQRRIFEQNKKNI